MTKAEQIILTTRKKRKKQMIFKGISAVYMTLITALLIYILVQIDLSLLTNADNQNPTSSPTPEINLSDESDNEIDKNGKFVALTYDDGPASYTSYLLDALEEHDAKATFFIVGNRADKYRDTIKRMDYLDMEIASHTYGHEILLELDAVEIKETMDKADEAFTEVIGHGATLMRPVGGNTNDIIKATVNKPIIHWNIDTLDWQIKDTQAIVDHVLENVHDGCIVLMHDIYPTTIEASKILIPKLQEMGYQLVTVSELADARDVELVPGEVYSSFPKNEN